MAPGADDLLASFWTLAGRLDVGDPGPSPWSFEQRVAAAAAAGYAGIGIEHRDVLAYLDGPGLAQMHAVIAGAGLDLVELELITGWIDDARPGAALPGAEQRRRVRADLLQAASVLGARHIKIGGGMVDNGVSTEHIAESFAALCRQAAEAGTSVVLELLPVGPVSTLARAVEIVSRAAADNGGLLLDAWHVQRAGVSLDEIAALQAGVLRYVELCDGMPASGLPLFEDTTRNRMPCGDGQFDLESFVDSVRKSGYGGPYGVEILSSSLRTHPVTEIAERTASTAAALLAW
ncbi:MAG: hypothetical protein JWL97_4038 [Gemmatimonadales bacterium]|nr:hypothetical protein [Gemmatimonadales bacterium]